MANGLTPIISTLSRGESGVGDFPTTTQVDASIFYISTNTLAERNAIPVWKRWPFMVCKVIETGLEYELGSDLTIAGQVWTIKTFGVPDNVVLEDEIFDTNGFIKPQLLPNIFLNSQYVVDDEAAMLALTTLTGNFIIRNDTGTVYVKLDDTNPASLSDFAVFNTPATVTSVNSQTGVVSITIANLLAVTQNLTDLNTAIGNNTTVLGHTTSIATIQSNITTINTTLTSKADLVSGVVPHSQLPYAFNNGLTRTGNNVTFGGSLLADTIIIGNFALNFGDSTNRIGTFSLYSNQDLYFGTSGSTKQIIFSTNTGQITLDTAGGAIINSVGAGYFGITTGTSTLSFSNAGFNVILQNAANTSITELFAFYGRLSNTAQIGHGQATGYYLEDSAGTDKLVLSTKISYGTITSGQEDIIYDIQGIEDGTIKSIFKINTATSTVTLGEQNALFSISGNNYWNTTGAIAIGGTTAQVSSSLDLQSTTKALLLNRVANTGDIPTPENGMIVYRTSNNQFYVYGGGTWKILSSATSGSWGSITGTITDQTDLINYFIKVNDSTEVISSTIISMETADDVEEDRFIIQNKWFYSSSPLPSTTFLRFGSSAIDGYAEFGVKGDIDGGKIVLKAIQNDIIDFGYGLFIEDTRGDGLDNGLQYLVTPTNPTDLSIMDREYNDSRYVITTDLPNAHTYRGKQTFTFSGPVASINIPNRGADPGGTISNNDIWGKNNNLYIKLNGVISQFVTSSATGIQLEGATDGVKVAITESTNPDRRIESVQIGTGNVNSTADGSSSVSMFQTSGVSNNSVISMSIIWAFIKSDGSSSGSVEITTTWRKDNSGTVTKVSDLIGPSLVNAAGTWQLTTSLSGTIIQATLTRNSTTGDYNGAVYIKSKVVHKY